MSDPTPLSTPASSAGLLELLRLFRNDQAAADRYAAARLEQAKAVEPVLKAFEFLPTDTTRRPGPLSGIPVGIKDIIATSDMPTTNGSPIYRDHVPAADAWVVERLAQSRRHDLRQDGIDGIRLAASGADHQPLEPRPHPGRIVVGIRGGGRGGHRSAGVGHADAGLGGKTGRVQRRRRIQAELRRDPAHRASII